MIGFTNFNVILTTYFYEKNRKKNVGKLLCNALQAELLSSAIIVSTYNKKKVIQIQLRGSSKDIKPPLMTHR